MSFLSKWWLINAYISPIFIPRHAYVTHPFPSFDNVIIGRYIWHLCPQNFDGSIQRKKESAVCGPFWFCRRLLTVRLGIMSQRKALLYLSRASREINSRVSSLPGRSRKRRLDVVMQNMEANKLTIEDFELTAKCSRLIWKLDSGNKKKIVWVIQNGNNNKFGILSVSKKRLKKIITTIQPQLMNFLRKTKTINSLRSFTT